MLKAEIKYTHVLNEASNLLISLISCVNLCDLLLIRMYRSSLHFLGLVNFKNSRQNHTIKRSVTCVNFLIDAKIHQLSDSSSKSEKLKQAKTVQTF